MATATDKIYKCGHCGTTNDSLDSLKQHMLEAHMSNPPSQPNAAAGDSLSLPVEKPSTSSVVSVPKPVQPTDPPSEPKPAGRFKCGHCGIIVATMDKLKSHMLTTHVNDQTGEHAGQQVTPPVAKGNFITFLLFAFIYRFLLYCAYLSDTCILYISTADLAILPNVKFFLRRAASIIKV